LPTPTNIKGRRSFAGAVNYLSAFLPKLQDILKSIYKLTKKNVKFEWGPEQEKSFQLIKNLLRKALVLLMPTEKGEFVLYSDTSKKAAGGSLFQVQKGQEKLITYHSKSLPPSEERWSISELELASLCYNMVALKNIIGGVHFTAYVDHSALVNIMGSSSEPPTLYIKKLLEKLTGYHFTLHFKPGSEMKVCDFLSQSHDPNDKPGSRICPIAMSSLAEGWAQGIHVRMNKENKLEDEIDLPAPLPFTVYRFDLEKGYDNKEYQTYLTLAEANRRVTRSMTRNATSQASTPPSCPSPILAPRTRSLN
jgi:hypothetical protein